MNGQRFGRFLVIGPSNKVGKRQYLLCRCDCGVERAVRMDGLKSGRSTSCGCRMKEVNGTRIGTQATVHGHTTDRRRTPTFNSWRAMLARCNDPKADAYPWYGGAGIKVCDRWLSFENFLADMGKRPPGTTIDRRDGSLGYDPGNCRWATKAAQSGNKAKTLFIEHDGVRRTIKDWAVTKGIKYHTLFYRIKQGWPAARALNEHS